MYENSELVDVSETKDKTSKTKSSTGVESLLYSVSVRQNEKVDSYKTKLLHYLLEPAWWGFGCCRLSPGSRLVVREAQKFNSSLSWWPPVSLTRRGGACGPALVGAPAYSVLCRRPVTTPRGAAARGGYPRRPAFLFVTPGVSGVLSLACRNALGPRPPRRGAG